MAKVHSERSLGVARRGIANGIAAALLAAFGTGNALAFQLDTSYNPDLSVRLDTTVRVNYAVRTESRDNKIGNDVIADEGDYSFDKGDAVAKRLDLLSELDVVYKKRYGFRVSGTTGTLEWSITDHTVLKHYTGGQPLRLYRQGAEYGYFPGSIKPYLRLPSGHPEGFHEALANLHRTLEWTIRGQRGETVPTPFEHPGIIDGVAGMAFVEAAVASSQKDGAWVEMPKIG